MTLQRVCIIVDNPLRDIEGLVLVAAELALNGIEAFLVPMYNQAFDVFAIKPDLVLANYARPNNIWLLQRFYAAGCMVGILDTEGSPGRNLDGFADMVKRTRCGEFVDLYCIWGEKQYEVFQKHSVVNNHALVKTGCPRYDFCSFPMRNALNRPDVAPGFVLINTAFPLANPRFTSGPDDELKTMIKVGYEENFAKQVVNDACYAYKHTVDAVAALARKLPGQRFILRPHPFEDVMAYDELNALPNVAVRQEGTSLEWINASLLLIHLNCITAVEAVLLDKESISFEWFNTPALLAQSPPMNVSHNAESQEHLEMLVQKVIQGEALTISKDLARSRQDIISERYYRNDGNSAKRVSRAIKHALKEGSTTKKIQKNINFSSSAKQTLREITGFKNFHFFRKKLLGGASEYRRDSKKFSLNKVERIISRISNASDRVKDIKACYANESDMKKPYLGSFQAIKIYV